MTKDEMRSAWQEQWNETHELYKFVCKEFDFQVARQQKFLEEGKTDECYAMTGCITGLRAIKTGLESILYKEI